MLSLYLSMVETDDERELVTKLYQTYRQRMYNLAYGILNNKHDAEDAVSTAFIRIINNLNKISDFESSKTRGFVFIITKNSAIDIYNLRKKNIYTDIDELDIADDIKIEEEVINRFDYKAVKEAISRLNDNYQNVLILHYYYDLSIKDISLSLGITNKAAKSRLYRAQEKLLKELGGKSDE